MPNPPGTGLPHPQSYDVSNPDWVKDNVTGLVWQRNIAGESFVWTDAGAYCARLSLGKGGGPWRLPTVIELVSLVDFTRSDPAIDGTAFPNTPGAPFWTSQTDVTNAGLAWYVFFKNGGAYGGNDIVDPQKVRCVR